MANEHSGEQDGPSAQRAEEIAERFRTLPPAGTPAYWAAIEHLDQTARLPLETVARALQERFRAGDAIGAHRIFETLMRRTERALSQQARNVAAKNRRADRAHDLMQTIVDTTLLGIWQALTTKEKTFFTVGFWKALDYEFSHAVSSALAAEGVRLRGDPERGRRIPSAKLDSLDEQRGGPEDEGYTLDPPDQSAQAAFDRLQKLDDVRDLCAVLSPIQVAVLMKHMWQGYTQRETAEHLGITDRYVRMLIQQIRDAARRLWGRDEEDGNV